MMEGCIVKKIMDEKLKVMLVAPPPSSKGGIANWVRIISAYAKTSDLFDIVQYCTRTYKNVKHSFWERYVLNGLDLPVLYFKLKKMIKKQKPDIIHITATGEWSIIRDLLVMRIAKKRKVPTVYHLRFGKVPDYEKANGKKWKFIKKAFDRTNAIWALDSETIKVVKGHYPGKPVCFIPNPVDFSDIVCEKKNIDDAVKHVLFVGWVVKTKGIEELLQSWAQLSGKRKDYVLDIVGPNNEEYLSYVRENYPTESVEFLGAKDHKEIMKMMAASEIFVLPSYTEGFPNVVGEAMASEKAIIATRVGAIPDMLADECGILIDSKSVTELTEALELLMNDHKLREKLAANAKNKALNKYSVQSVVAEYISVWRSIAEVNYKEKSV